MSESVFFFVEGVPIPQGSKSAKALPNGRVILYEGSKLLKPWREQVHWAALQARGRRPTLLGPVSVRLMFHVKHSSRSRIGPHPIGKPDLDKLTRAIFDALTTAKVFHDDSQVIDLYAHKAWAVDAPGVSIDVTPWDDSDA